eukprot:SAG11_NODE_19144_length_473_cov_0.967914_1_plen_70_part_01
MEEERSDELHICKYKLLVVARGRARIIPSLGLGATPSPSAHPLRFRSSSETLQGPSDAPRTHLCANGDNA